MKKSLFVLMVLLLTAPAMALTISCEGDANGSGVVTVSYSGGDAQDPPRAFALDIQLDSGATIVVDSTNADDSNFTTYPGTIVIEDGNVTDEGTPVADPCDHQDTGDGEGTDNMTTEQGSLYDDPNDQPGTSGLLVSFTVSGDCNVSITSNVIRGKVVLESGASVDLSTSCEVDVDDDPTCWSYDCFDCGDGDGDCELTFGDITLLINGWPPNDYIPCADFTKDTEMTFADITVLINNWPPNGGCANCGSCTPIP